MIPLKSIGLTIVPDAPYKFDWSILLSGPKGGEGSGDKVVEEFGLDPDEE